MAKGLNERSATRNRTHLRMPMRGGFELSADLYYRESYDPSPAIIKYHPYRNEDLLRDPTSDRANRYAAHGYSTTLPCLAHARPSSTQPDRRSRSTASGAATRTTIKATTLIIGGRRDIVVPGPSNMYMNSNPDVAEYVMFDPYLRLALTDRLPDLARRNASTPSGSL